MVYRQGSRVEEERPSLCGRFTCQCGSARSRPVGVLPFFSDATSVYAPPGAIDSPIVRGSAETSFYLCCIFSTCLRLSSAHLKRCI